MRQGSGPDFAGGSAALSAPTVKKILSAVIGADVSRRLWKGKVVDFMLMILIVSWHSSSERIRAHPWHAWRIAFPLQMAASVSGPLLAPLTCWLSSSSRFH